jgi:phenylalanyl-tRNA synthetase alpha chain
MALTAEIDLLTSNFTQALNQASTLSDLNEVYRIYFSKTGELSQLTNQIRTLDPSERPAFGKTINELKTNLETLFQAQQALFTEQERIKKLQSERIDVTLPGFELGQGTIHPLTQTIAEIEDIFLGQGFLVEDGPELEQDYYNFELMGLPKGHPARSMQDSFFVTPETLLRTQTSAVQARVMLREKPNPIRIICPGKTYRRDNDDTTHSHQFMQIEGLVVDQGITFSNLLYYLKTFLNQFFGGEQEIRIRPSYFPFTEPSIEVDLVYQNGNKKRYLEILGAGMVNREVLRGCGYNPDVYTGFAFGIGVERLCMIRHQVDNIRHFYNNDLRFLKQFRGQR